MKTNLDLKREFDRLNKELFEGILPPIKLSFSSTLKKASGKIEYKIHWIGSIIGDITFSSIKISSFYHFTDERIINTLIHEMIHYWQWIKLKRRPNHDSSFINKMNEINNRSGNNKYNVDLKSNLDGFQTTPNEKSSNFFCLGILIQNKGTDRFGLLLMDRHIDEETIIHFGKYINKSVYDVFIVGISDPYFKRYTVIKTLPKNGKMKFVVIEGDLGWKLVDDKQLANLTKLVNEPVIKKNPINESSYPKGFSYKELDALSFDEAEEYCDAHLEKIGDGSSRAVYALDDKRVLKLAVNPRGIAQNKNEIEISDFDHDIMARVLNHDKRFEYLEMERARKFDNETFKRIIGIDIAFVQLGLRTKQFSKPMLKMFEENDWMRSLVAICEEHDLFMLDILDTNQMGLVKRNGQDAIVIIDYGLTNGAWNKFYQRI